MIRLLLNGEVYDPLPRGRQHLAVCAGRVIWRGAEPPAIDPQLVEEEIDLDGRRVIPGLVDAHVHLTGGGGEAGPASRVPPLPLSALTLAGVTTAVGILGTDDATRSPAALVATCRGLVDEGLSAWCHTGGYHLPPATVTGSVRDDILYVDRVIGVGEVAISDHRSSQPTLDELLRLASEAHVAGMLAGKAGIVHLHLGDGERGLDLVRRALDGSELPPRVFNPTHVNRRRALFDEALALAERGCTIDVTAFPQAENDDELTGVEAITAYLESGLPPERLTVSSDAGGSLPVFDSAGGVQRMDVGKSDTLPLALAALVEAGRDLAAVLPAFTANPAALLRLPRKGRLEVGCDADLVVLGRLGEVEEVMAGGRWHVRAGKCVATGTFERRERAARRRPEPALARGSR